MVKTAAHAAFADRTGFQSSTSRATINPRFTTPIAPLSPQVPCNFAQRSFGSPLSASNFGFGGDAPDVILDDAGELFNGTLIAFSLAFLFSFLRGRPTTSDIVLLPPIQNDENEDSSASESGKEDAVFGADSWKDVSREENYVLYNTRVKAKLKQLRGEDIPSVGKNIAKTSGARGEENSGEQERLKEEQRRTVIGLSLLFIPIFFADLFLALSRLFVCEVSSFSWSGTFCAPHL